MNLFDLFIKIGVDDQASDKIEGISTKVKKGLVTAAKIGSAALATAAAGVAALVKTSVQNYAEYEQLVGGVDTLFKNSSQKVQKYASQAYKTTGMSANDYMANATAFSASLINSLAGDTDAAAEYANRAMVSMSDNANKMGTNIDSIVQTYQSLSRGNYAMLDNLKLGYGGTRAELERLIKDAASYTEIQKEMGITVDASSMSFDNIVNAIAVVQGHLGIAGATAQEAATTIEGSINSMKASWDNLITAMSDDNANFSTKMNEFVESVTTVASNIVPRTIQGLKGAVNLVSELAPVFAEALPGFVKEVVPEFIKAAFSVVGAVLDSLPELVDGVLEMLPGAIKSVAAGIVELAPQIFEAVVGIVESLVENIGPIIDTLIEVIPQITESVSDAIVDNFPALLTGIINLIVKLIENLPSLILMLTQQIGPIMATVVQVMIENLPLIIGGIVQIIFAIVEALPEILMGIWEALAGWIFSMVENIVAKGPEITEGFKEAFAGAVEGVKDAWESVKEWAQNTWESVSSWISGKWTAMKNLGRDVINGLWEGLKEVWTKVSNWFTNAWDTVTSKVRKILGIMSPSRVYKKIGEYVALGYGEGFLSAFADVEKDMLGAIDGMDDMISYSDYEISGLESGRSVGGVNITQNIYAEKMSPAQAFFEARAMQERAVFMSV